MDDVWFTAFDEVLWNGLRYLVDYYWPVEHMVVIRQPGCAGCMVVPDNSLKLVL